MTHPRPMSEEDFARLVSLACHDLRSPLATVSGFAKTLVRTAELDERSTRFLGMIDEAGGQLADLIDLLSLAARIAGDRYEPLLGDANTLGLASSADERVAVEGRGERIETDVEAVRRSLESLAIAAVRHGGVEQATWRVDGRELTLAPVTAEAGPILLGESPRDLGSLVARMTIERLGGTVAHEGETLRVRL